MKNFFIKILKKVFLKGFESNPKKAYFWLTLNIIVNISVAFLEGFSFACILFAFGSLTDFETFLKNPILDKLYLGNTLGHFSAQIVFTIFIIAAVLIQTIRSIFNYIGLVISANMATVIQVGIQNEIYKKIMSFTFSFVSRYKTGDLTEYVKAPAVTIANIFQAINQLLVSLLTVIISIIIMATISVKLTIITLFLMTLFGLSQKKIMKKIQDSSTAFSDNMVDLSKHVTQTFQGLRTIFTFDQQKKAIDKAKKTLGNISKTSRFLHIIYFAVQAINETIGIILVGICCILGPYFFEVSSFSIASLLLTFITVTYRMASKVQMLLNSIGTINYNYGQMTRINDLLSDQNKEFSRTGGEKIDSFKRSIVFKNVFLKYFSRESYSVSDVSLNIKKGSTVAFVGFSGAGKSSIIDLLIGLYEPSQGVIAIDDRDLNKLDLSSWRQKLGVVCQDTFILNDTLEENIRFGFNQCSLNQVIDAAKVAGAHDFISTFPNSYSAIVGERGYKLSGGEKQRIALARAILRKPEVLILDEATSNLDSKSEHLIQDFLNKFHKSKTIIVIAHRLSTIINADEIFVVDKGSIVERGSHYSLIKQEGIYAKLWGLQTIGFKETHDKPLEDSLKALV